MFGDSSFAQIHFVTGKGGVGKSTVAAALAQEFLKRDEGPVLILEIQGSGKCLSLLGGEGTNASVHPLRLAPGAFGAVLNPRDSFREYFSLLLSLGSEDSAFGLATRGLRSKVLDLVLENRVVSAFVDVCPGLEPAVLLGKIHWEAKHGGPAESKSPWRHVVVDAPATGHALMLFRSTFALLRVFEKGLILRQATEIKADLTNSSRCRLLLVSTIEELALSETLELANEMNNLGIRTQELFLNRKTFQPSDHLEVPKDLEGAWVREIQFERDAYRDQEKLLSEWSPTFVQKFPQAKLRQAHTHFEDNALLLLKKLREEFFGEKP